MNTIRWRKVNYNGMNAWIGTRQYARVMIVQLPSNAYQIRIDNKAIANRESLRIAKHEIELQFNPINRSINNAIKDGE